ncbi:MAG: ATP-binding protein [Candidatus Jordarchaeaceae archaeon]
MWIVSGTEGDLIKLVSSKDVDGILPVGSYLTVTDDKSVKHILVVEKSYQKSLFEPSPLIVDAELPLLEQDQECKNIVLAREIRQFPSRPDGLFSFIKPNDVARRTSQQEIDEIFTSKDGFPVFLATSFLTQNSILKDDLGRLIYVKIPFDSLYLQTMICGQTGSGKTVAMKYLIEQFLTHEKGAVLAINVKAIDLLTMDQPTTIKNEKLEKQTCEEWATLGFSTPDIGDFRIYVPAGTQKHKEGVTREKVTSITLRTRDLEPNSLLGVLQNITDRAAEALPNIFRYWTERVHGEEITFRNFIRWFRLRATKENEYLFPTLSQSGEESEIPLHPGTCTAILRSLESAIDFFDSQEEDCLPIREDDIMSPGKLSVIDVSNKDTLTFGAVLLRHLLSKIYEAKAIKGQYSDIPVLIVIDEVHHFYRSGASAQALEELNAIARMGRSEKIGVIFASQNPEDLPSGLTSIVNTRIFFRSLGTIGKKFGIKEMSIELSSLENGYAAISSIALPQLRLVKFPISLMGVKS